MKKVIVLFALITLIPAGVAAQLSVGAKGGLTFASFSNVKGDTESQAGYKAGVFFRYMISDFGLESGLYLKQVGIHDSNGFLMNKLGEEEAVSMKVRPKYFELPILAVYKYRIDENVSVFANGGAYLAVGYGGGGLVRHAKGSYGIDAFDDFIIKNDQEFLDYRAEGASGFDFGLSAGAGLEMYNVSLSVNYDLGLGKVYKHYPISETSKNIRNRVFWIGLGYRFDI